MHRALWKKSLNEGKWLLLASAVCLFAFHWLWVWLTSQLKVAHMQRILENLVPDLLQKLLPVPIDVIASPTGRIAMAYEEPLVIVLVCIWAIARGSDSVSGEVSRGTMEMLLAQPVRRLEVLLTHAAVTVLGSAVLAAWAWFGTYAGVLTVTLEEEVSQQVFLTAALNLFCLGLFVGGVTTMVSAFDRNRGRTIGLVVGFYVFQVILKIVGLMAPNFDWLRGYTILSCFEPQILVNRFRPGSEMPWGMLWDYNGPMIYLGLVSFLIAAIVFCRRDLPAPL